MPYHLRITPTAWKRRSPDIVTLGKSADWIEETIAAPRRQGRDIFVEGQTLSWDDIDRIQITQTDQAIADQIARSHAAGTGGDLVLLDRFGRDVTEQFLTGPPGARPDPEPGKTTTFAANRKAVMVIYGHDAAANTALFDWLRSIGLQPQEWSQLIHASTDGPADNKPGKCYYALLSSTNTQDIITNAYVGGPLTIEIGPDVKAVHFTGCKPWHRLETSALSHRQTPHGRQRSPRPHHPSDPAEAEPRM